MMRRRTFLQGATMAAVLTRVAPARAATAADTGRLSGADRTAQLVAGAKKEGTVTIYSSAVVEDMNAVTAAFTKKYGVKVQAWRGASEDILQRTVTEARGQRYDADIVETAAPQMEAISRENLLETVSSPVFADIMPAARVAGRPWIPSRLLAFTGAYNTNLVKKADLPKSYDDLLNPKWKGKLGIEAADNNWLMALDDAMGTGKGVKMLHDIVAKNGISVRKGHTLMANLVVSGEVPIALTVYDHEVEPLKKAGAPIEFLNLPPVIAFVTAAGVPKRAPHPYAAMLFMDFLLTDGQDILSKGGNVPINVKYQHLPKDMKLSFMNVPKYLDESAKWTQTFKDIVSQRA